LALFRPSLNNSASRFAELSVHGCGAILTFAFLPIVWLFAFDVDRETHSRFGSQSIVSVFLTLAAFAFSGVIGLTAALSGLATAVFGEKQFVFALSLYIALSVYQIVVKVALLRTVDYRGKPSRPFDVGSIRIGRLTLAVSLLTSFAFTVLAWNGYLNLGSRKEYPEQPIVFGQPQSDAVHLIDHRETDATRELITTLHRGLKPDPRSNLEQVVWMYEQKGVFQDDYETFTARFYFGDNVQVHTAIAYLLNDPTLSKDSTQRPMLVPKDLGRLKLGGTVEISRPAKNTFLVILVLVTKPAAGVVPTTLTLEREFP
jgi:hypothetical protein